MSQFARNLGLLGNNAHGGGGNDGFGVDMNPLTNDQPLQFSDNKGPNIQMGGGEPSAMGNDYDKKGDNGGDNNFGGSNWPQQQQQQQQGGMMNPMGMAGMGLPGMMPGFNNDMSGEYSGYDPNMANMANMGMGMGMFPPPPMDMSARDTIYLKESTLFPPPQNAPPPTTKERPPGCRTVFVGGLPENANEAIMREVFERCGEIMSYRQGRRNFCHIRFAQEMHVDNAVYLSGYRMRIGAGEESIDTGRLHVDFATARDDQYEFECQQRRLAREMRHQQVLEGQRMRPPTPPQPSITHFSEHEAGILNDQLKGEESFAKGTSQLISWLERGDCSKRTANSFYGMIQVVNSHVRRLMNEKQQFDEELQQARAYHNQRVTGILVQFTLIEQVFNSASKQRAWDHFTKAQRKNLDLWRKQAKELKVNQQEELGLAEKGEEDMDLSDEEEKPRPKKQNTEIQVIQIDDEPPDAKRIKMMATENELMSLKEENQSMSCQIEAYKNEVEIMKGDHNKYSEEKETQIKALQHALVGMQQQLMEAKAKLRKEEEAREATKKSSTTDEMESSSTTPTTTSTTTTSEKKPEPAESPSNGSDIDIIPPGIESASPVPAAAAAAVAFAAAAAAAEPKVTTPVIVNLKERDALLVGFMATFLHVHPFGASVEYLWSYLQRLDPSTTSLEIEVLLNKFPKIFKLELFGVGASLEKRWKFVGFTTCLGNSKK